MRILILASAAGLLLVGPALTRREYPPVLKDAQQEVYKKIGDVELNLYVFRPADSSPTPRPAIVFFFGGGWKNGSPRQFEQQCRHLAERGMVAITADYRVSSRHQTKAKQCVADGKSAIRWVRANAKRLQVDPNRIVAAGGSAGGHIAACAGVLSRWDEPNEDLKVSSRPNLMILFCPAVVLAPVDGSELKSEKAAGLRERMGTDPRDLSPYHHVAPGVPPTLIFHGKADTTVPYRTAELFAEAMTKAGNSCELSGFPDAPHGFFNYGRDDNKAFNETIRQMDAFLAKQGYLKP